MKVMTFNIRQDNGLDGVNNWSHRKEMAASMINFHDVDVLGLQEVFYNQLTDLESLLPDYQWTGVCREDGKKKGEAVPVFYKASRIVLLDSGNFWLSETPGVPGSKGWDADCIRMCTWARLLEKESGIEFYMFNTHLDHIGEMAQIKGSELILQTIKQLVGQNPFILCGDFNVTPETDVYRMITADPSAIQDSGKVCQFPHHGPEFTCHDYQVGELMTLTESSQDDSKNDPKGLIDYIFVSSPMKVIRHGTLSDHWGGRFPSDHMPVLTQIVLG